MSVNLELKLFDSLENKNRNSSSLNEILQMSTRRDQVPFARDIQKKIPIYDGKSLASLQTDPAMCIKLLYEWAWVFSEGPGIIVIQEAISNLDVIAQASRVFEDIIGLEKEKKTAGDHFAKPGSNDRIWNSLEKHCENNPANFIEYYKEPTINLAALAWLGPGYQVTAQVNRVNPGGNAQQPHRDYHLGFMPTEKAKFYQRHVHLISPYLTLQGAIAHCDMPIESGPTQLLPFSQKLERGYVSIGQADVRQVFLDNYAQLSLKSGDMIFFNPAVFHAAGENQSSSILRLVNLLQISSPFGRAMEKVDRRRMCLTLYPKLLEAKKSITISKLELINVISAFAEGYSFPNNLDLNPPIDGNAPKTQAEYLFEALENQETLEVFSSKIGSKKT